MENLFKLEMGDGKMEKKMVPWWVGFFLGMILAIIHVFWGKGHFLYNTNLLMFSVLCVHVAAVLFLYGFFPRDIQSTNVKTKCRQMSAIILISVVIQFVSLPFASLQYEKQVAKTISYCESLIPCIEKYKTTTGKFPSDISLCAPLGPPKGLLLNKIFYFTHGDEYSFEIDDRQQVMGSIIWTSKKNRWVKY